MNSLSLNSTSSLSEWLQYLESLHPKEIDLGLDRVKRVANQMDLYSKIASLGATIITVAGTNGKGSCVSTLESLLLAANKTVGTYTSPHFLEYNERIRLGGANASDEKIVSAFCEIEKSREGIRLTYFEFGTLAAIWLFLDSKIDIFVLEVGLGGRLDAVNAFDPDIAVMTSVALDHQDWLGNDREIIGFEKAGIFRSNKPALCVDDAPPQSVIDYAKKINVDFYLKGREIKWAIENHLFSWQGIDTQKNKIFLENLPVPTLPMPSVAAALQAVVLLGCDLTELPIKKILSTLSLTGRAQEIKIDGKRILLDVAHNPAAALYLRETLKSKKAKRIIAVFAVMADKDYKSIFKTLDDQINYWFVSGIPNVSRAESSKKLGTSLVQLGLDGSSYDTVLDSFSAALSEATADDLIVVLGSFYTVADILNNYSSDSLTKSEKLKK
ncbi:MAG: bifunctional tetrahydrofolate synthase/dihydrofolate synthase [Cellvibrionaceae bacterium]